jgi:hypothetical protein
MAASASQSFSGIDPQPGFGLLRAVTRVTALDENRPDLALEEPHLHRNAKRFLGKALDQREGRA